MASTSSRQRRALWHRITGLPLCVIMFLFAVTGLLWQHSDLIRGVSISRSVLPPAYGAEHWSNGLMRGTLRCGNELYLYGEAGLFRCPNNNTADAEPVPGLPQGQAVRRAVVMPSGHLVALHGNAVSVLAPGASTWQQLKPGKLRPTDLCAKGDTLCIVGRNGLMQAEAPYTELKPLAVMPPEGAPGGGTLYGHVKHLHCGRLFGIVGIVVVDIIAGVFILLCLTGLVFWVLHKLMPRLRGAKWAPKVLKFSHIFHTRPGHWCFWLLFLVVLTGWAMRFPLQGLLLSSSVPDEKAAQTAWLGRDPGIAANSATGELLIAASGRIYSLAEGQPRPVLVTNLPSLGRSAPAYFAVQPNGDWLIAGSAGLLQYSKSNGEARTLQAGDFSGYSVELGGKAIPCRGGLPELAMPESVAQSRVPLIQVVRDVHTGKFFFGSASPAYVSIAGLAALLCLLTGWLLKPPAKHSKPTPAAQEKDAAK